MELRLRDWFSANGLSLKADGFAVELNELSGQHSITGEADTGFFEITDWDEGYFDWLALRLDEKIPDLLERGDLEDRTDDLFEGIYRRIKAHLD